MIELVRKKTISEYFDLIDIVRNCDNQDFYITENNQRIFVKNTSDLKKLLKNSYNVFYENEFDRKGIILVWKSFGGEKARKFIKLVADSKQEVRDLLTILLWRYNKELYVKLRKESPYISVFREKGFNFIGNRGSEVLLFRKPYFDGARNNNVNVNNKHQIQSQSNPQ